MEFNVAQLIKDSPGAIKSCPLSDHLLSLENQTADKMSLLDTSKEISLSGTAEMIRTDAGIWVTAILNCEVVCQCARCLTPHTRKLSLKIDEEYYVNTYISNTFEIEKTQFISNENILDLAPSICDHIHLEIPLNPICSKNCAGICVNCGFNLNLDSCICKNTAEC